MVSPLPQTTEVHMILLYTMQKCLSIPRDLTLASLRAPRMVESFLEGEVTMRFMSLPTRVKKGGSMEGVQRFAILARALPRLHQR